jgi:hypothetical protein
MAIIACVVEWDSLIHDDVLEVYEVVYFLTTSGCAYAPSSDSIVVDTCTRPL